MAYGVKVMSNPQGKICDNDILPPAGVDEDEVRSLSVPAVNALPFDASCESYQSKLEPLAYIKEFEDTNPTRRACMSASRLTGRVPISQCIYTSPDLMDIFKILPFGNGVHRQWASLPFGGLIR